MTAPRRGGLPAAGGKKSVKKGRAAKKNATGGGKRRPTKESEQVGGQVADIYEAEEIKEEGANRPGRYDPVDNYEYEMPSDFEDEEIDEDEAFNDEDKRLYSEWFPPSDDDDVYEGEEKEEEEEEEGRKLLDSDEEADGDDSAGISEEEDSMMDGWDAMVDEEAEEEESVEEDGAHERMIAALKRGKAGPPRAAVVSEAYDENEYNLNPEATSLGTSAGALSMSKLLAGLGGEGQKGLGAARKELEQLERKAMPVEAPLPSNIAKRVERKVEPDAVQEAAYEETREDVTKWQQIVKANREAPTLRFERPGESLPRAAVSTASLAASFKPETDLEAEVAELLKAAGAHDGKAVEEVEEALALKKLTAEEVQERRAKLAKMRSLLFQHETKAKHLKKIKSKAYHRKLKKAAQLKAKKAGEVAGDDAEEDGEVIRLEAEQAALDRAKERISLKHKNTSRWARRALKRGQMNMDEGTKEAIAEQLRIGAELRRKAERMGASGGRSGSDGDDSTDASDSEDEEGGGEGGAYGGVRGTAKAKAAALEILEAAGQEGAQVPDKGLFALPFMRRALERKKLEASSAATAALAEIAAEEMAAEGRKTETPLVGGHAGRISFGRAKQGTKSAAVALPFDGVGYGDSLEYNSDGSSAEEGEGKGEKDEEQEREGTPGPLPPSNPEELKSAERLSASSGRLTLPVSEGEQKTAERKQLTSAKAKQKGEDGGVRPHARAFDAKPRPSAAPAKPAKDQGEAISDFVPAGKFCGSKQGYAFKAGAKGLGYYRDAPGSKGKKGASRKAEGAGGKGRGKGKPNGIQTEDADVVMLAEESDDGPARSQQDLIRMAFAGDDVEAEFEEAKRAEVEAELPEVDAPSLMPGWGTWSNQQREPRWMREKREQAEKARKAAAAGRADAKKRAVVISEKWDKKASKYGLEAVPHGFTGSKAIYEASMRHPLGRDYNTTSAFRNMTRPEILKDTGILINPVKYSKPSSDAGVDGLKKRDAVGPRGSKDLVKRARLRQ